MFDIAIVGEINLDLILYGLPAEMPVERELLAADFQATLGSSSAILAHNLAVLGAKVGFVSRIGRDELGRMAIGRVQESGADVSRAIFSTTPTPTGVTVLLHHGKARHILTYPGTMNELTIKDLDLDYLKSARHFHLSSLFLQKGLAPDLPWLFRELRLAGLTTSLDTNDDPENKWGGVLDELLGLVDVLLPNESEICRMAKRDTPEEAVAVLAKQVPCIAVKLGQRGSFVQSKGKRYEAAPIAVTTVDTIGAGDSYNAGFLLAWLRGLPLDVCAKAGNITGALSTQRSGGTEAFRDRTFAGAFLRQHGFPVASEVRSG
jgi:sugar/nucleoside kinase (ribokinase family)